MSPTDIPTALAFLAMTVPVGALAILGLCLLFIPTLSERRVHQIVGGGLLGGLIATLGIDLALAFGGAPVSLDIGSIIAVRGFHINLAMLVDGKAALFLTLDYLLCGLVGLFSARYLHQEEGFRRFYLLLTVFAVGVSLIAAARGLDLLPHAVRSRPGDRMIRGRWRNGDSGSIGFFDVPVLIPLMDSSR